VFEPMEKKKEANFATDHRQKIPYVNPEAMADLEGGKRKGGMTISEKKTIISKDKKKKKKKKKFFFASAWEKKEKKGFLPRSGKEGKGQRSESDCLLYANR